MNEQAEDSEQLAPGAGSGGDARFYAHPSGDGAICRSGSTTRLCLDELLAALNSVAARQPVGMEPSGWEIYNEVGKYVTFVKTVALRDAHLHRAEGDLLPQWEARPVYTAPPAPAAAAAVPVDAFAQAVRDARAEVFNNEPHVLATVEWIERRAARYIATHPQPAAAKTGHFTTDEMLEATAVLRAQQAKPEVGNG